MWQGTITEIGAQLLAEWVQGEGTLNVTGAEVGSGQTAYPREATALENKTGDASIIGKSKTNTGWILRVRVTPGEESYTAHEIGIFGNLDGETDALILLCQNTGAGIDVPNEFTDAEFAFDLSVALSVNGEGTMTVYADTDAYVTQEDLELRVPAETGTQGQVLTRTADGEEVAAWEDVPNVAYAIGTRIPNGTDLNSLTEPGNYYTDNPTAGTGSLSNCPVTGDVFRMEVTHIHYENSSNVLQRIYTKSGRDFFMRTKHSTGWNGWVRFLRDGEVYNNLVYCSSAVNFTAAAGWLPDVETGDLKLVMGYVLDSNVHQRIGDWESGKTHQLMFPASSTYRKTVFVTLNKQTDSLFSGTASTADTRFRPVHFMYINGTYYIRYL